MENGQTSLAIRLSRPAWAISAGDQRDLEWYFGDPQVATIRTGAFSALLERCKMFAGGFRPCGTCGGESRPQWRAGTGFVPANGNSYRRELVVYRRKMAAQYNLKVANGATADKLKLLGIETVTKARIAQLFPEYEGPKIACPVCDAIGIVPGPRVTGGEPTVRPTGSSKTGIEPDAALVLDEVAISRWGKVRTRLKRASGEWGPASDILRAYHEPAGSYRSLWRWTEAAGGLLARHADLKWSSPEDFFAQVVTSQRTIADPSVQRLLEAAQRDAISLLKDAGRAWNKGAR